MRENLYMDIYWTRESAKCAVACVLCFAYSPHELFLQIYVWMCESFSTSRDSFRVVAFCVIKNTRMLSYLLTFFFYVEDIFIVPSIPKNPTKFPCATSYGKSKGRLDLNLKNISFP